jgi:protein FAM32A
LIRKKKPKKIIEPAVEDEPLRQKTKAELEYEALKRTRVQLINEVHDRVEKNAEKSHKQKVEEFNKYLNSMSEYHDIPRVGPG